MNSGKTEWLDYLWLFFVGLIVVFLTGAADGREAKVPHTGEEKLQFSSPN